MNKLFFIGFLAMILSHCVQAQKPPMPTGMSEASYKNHLAKIDSAEKVLATFAHDTVKIKAMLSLSASYSSLKDSARAMHYVREAMSNSIRINSEIGQYSSFFRMGYNYSAFNNYEKAIAAHKEGIRIAEKQGMKKQLAGIHNEIGVSSIKLSLHDQAIKHLKLAAEYFTEANNTLGAVWAHQNIAISEKMRGNYPQAVDHNKTALKILATRKQPFDIHDEINISGNLGSVYQLMGQYDEAFRYISLAVNKADSIRNRFLATFAYSKMGSFYEVIGNTTEALNYYFKSLKLSEEIKNKPVIADNNKSIGNIYAGQKNYDEALKYFLVSKAVYEEIDYKSQLVDIFSNIGKAYLGKNIPGEALKYMNLAIQKAIETGERPTIANQYANMASFYYENYSQNDLSETEKKKRLELAENNYRAAFEINNSIGKKYSAAADLAGLGKSIHRQSDFLPVSSVKKNNEKALIILKQSLAIAEELKSPLLLQDASSAIAAVYRDLKDNDKAYNYIVMANRIKDSLLNNESTHKQQQSRISYEIEKAQNAEKTKQEQSKAQMKYSFEKREDSLKYAKHVTELELVEQFLLSKQNENELKLRRAELELEKSRNENTELALAKSEANYEIEQAKRIEQEKQLTILDQEKILQQNKISIGQKELALKEQQLASSKKEKYYYISGAILLLLLGLLTYKNFHNKQKAKVLLAAEKLKLAKANAAQKMVELELQSLRTQLNPHFMFNSLTAIQELILSQENERSHVYLSKFSRLVRMLLDNATEPIVSLRTELDFIDLYLSLENLRVKNMDYNINISPAINTGNMNVPNMILQPYIENAIWHGLSHKDGKRKLDINIDKRNGSIIFEIADNGVGRKKAAELKSQYRQKHNSKGMELLSKRFNLLSKEYGTNIKVDVSDIIDEDKVAGTKVQIEIPAELPVKSKPQYV